MPRRSQRIAAKRRKLNQEQWVDDDSSDSEYETESGGPESDSDGTGSEEEDIEDEDLEDDEDANDPTSSNPHVIAADNLLTTLFSFGRPKKNCLEALETHLKTRTELTSTEQDELKSTIVSLKASQESRRIDPIRLLRLPISNVFKHQLLTKWHELEQMDTSHHEYGKLNQYMEAICRIPFGVVRQGLLTSTQHDSSAILKTVLDTLNQEVFGQHQVKIEVLQWVAKQLLAESPKASALLCKVRWEWERPHWREPYRVCFRCP